MKKIQFLFFILLASLTSIGAQTVVINELQASNINTIRGPFFFEGYTDWVELKNTTSAIIDLSDYYLSDDEENIAKWRFPEGTTIAANGFLMVYPRGVETEAGSSDISATFKLSAAGEEVILSSPAEEIVDQVKFPAIQNDISYVRLDDGSYSFSTNPTPASANSTEGFFEEIDSPISISINSGLYDSPQTIEITTEGEGDIFYTLDGTKPDGSSTLYTSPITISDNTVLKAIVVQSSSVYSLIENRSYIFGAAHDLPVILLTSDNLLEEPKKDVIDGRVEFNFIETDGTTVISQYANFGASGKTSNFFAQLNGKVRASDVYGDGDFDHKMYPNKEIDEFESFLLRNASQDWANTYMRDAFISRLIGQDNLTDTPFNGYRPAVLYVNAKYHGIINVREDDDRDYVKHNFGLKDNEFNTKLGQGSDIVYIAFGGGDLDLNTEAGRALFAESVDFHELISLNLLAHGYARQGEWGWQVWEDLSGKTGTRYHYNFHDFDPTYGLAFDGANSTDIQDVPMAVNNLMRPIIRDNEPYKHEAIHFITASLNHLYNTERSFEIIDQMTADLASEIPAHAVAMNELADRSSVSYDEGEQPFSNIEQWYQNIEDLKTNIANMTDDSLFLRIRDEYGLDDPILISYSSSNINHGFIRVHDVKSIKEEFTGTYYKNIPVRFSAEALPGYQFVRWEGDVTESDLEIAPIFTDDAALVAVFEPVNVIEAPIIINEVQGKNTTTVADEAGEFNDWIEIYNPTDSDVNLAGYYISDNLEIPLKYQILDSDPAKTTVLSGGYLLLWADGDLDQGENHLDFKLKTSDEVVLTSPDASTVIHQISYSDVDEDKSYGAEVDADPNYIIFDIPTPNAANMTITNNKNIVDKEDFKIYPNPVSDILNISGDFLNSSWEIFDAFGKRVKNGSTKTIDLSELETGLYLININRSRTIKFIKIR